jgi:hypothetical protein
MNVGRIDGARADQSHPLTRLPAGIDVPAPNPVKIALAKRTLKPLALSAAERTALQRWARQSTAEYRVVMRSRILLLLDQQLSARAVARVLQTTRHTVDLWRRRFTTEGIDCVTRDRPGRGRRKQTRDGRE